MINSKWKRYIKPKPQYIKHTCILLAIIISFFAIIIHPTYTYCTNASLSEMSDELSSNVNDLIGDIDFSEIELIVQDFDRNQTKMFSISNVKDKVISIINGENAVDYNTMLETILQIVLQMIIEYVPMFALIVGIGIISSLLGQIKSKFAEKSTADIVHFVCFCLIIVALGTSVKRLLSSTTSTLENMGNTTNVLFPIILTLMTGIGAVSSVGVFQPVLAVMSNLISIVILKVVA